MAAQLISGTEIAKTIREELKDRVREMSESGTTPGIATVLVGENPASKLYVGMKGKAAAEVGIHSRQITLDEDCPEDELLDLIEDLNRDPDIHGILVQLPLPDQIDDRKVLVAIDPAKDVDGFHPINVGALFSGDDTALAPCTPKGVLEMLFRTGNDPAGKRCVIVGRSNIVGRPMASLLIRHHGTVTVAHSRTRDLGAVCREADILVAAVGRPGTITADMVKPGAVVIDVGTTRVEAPDRPRGFRVVGDVDFDSVSEVASWITPVPGGVGPMTIAMLLMNTVEAAARSVERAGA
jgi:methylenetetrahydrofolate dehydrogenase (NADP+)/methenyltetrahydrofolate cyclohydrolase